MKLSEREKEVARAAYMCHFPHGWDAVYAAIEAVLEMREKEQPEQRVHIGEMRNRLFAPFPCAWNGLVRDITAADEHAESVSPVAVMEALIKSICDRAYLDHSFPERDHCGVIGLFKSAPPQPPIAQEPQPDIASNGCAGWAEPQLPQSQPAAGDVIERMLEAYRYSTAPNSPPQDKITAAYSIASAEKDAEFQKKLAEQEERLLREATPEERLRARYLDNEGKDMGEILLDFLACRRTQKPDPEQRVTIQRKSASILQWGVFLDGGFQVAVPSEQDAERYRLGLIAELRAADAKERRHD